MTSKEGWGGTGETTFALPLKIRKTPPPIKSNAISKTIIPSQFFGLDLSRYELSIISYPDYTNTVSK